MTTPIGPTRSVTGVDRPPALQVRVGVVAASLVAVHAVVAGGILAHGARWPARVLACVGGLVALAAVPRAVRALDRRARGALFVSIGTGATAVGVGATVQNLVRVGGTPADVSGVVSLLAGVVLLAIGAADVVGSIQRRRRRWLAVPVGILFLYWVLVPVTIGVLATSAVPEPLDAATPADRGVPYEDVIVPAADGTPLAAWYVPSRNGGAVVLRHGSGSNRSGVLDQLVVLARAGFGVLAMDARGHGESGGRAMAFGWNGAAEVSAGVTFLQSRTEVVADRIGVLGLSMGGEEAITAAALDARIAAVVAEGATIRSTQDFLQIDKGLAMWVSVPHYAVMYATADLLSSASVPLPRSEAIRRVSPRPVVLIAAGEVADEQRFAAAYRSASPSTTDVWVAPGSGHTGGLATAPVEWSARVLRAFSVLQV